jgi:hypothetical protein
LSDEFDQMLLKVAADDVKSFKNNNNWLENHPGTAPLFKDLDSFWPKLRTAYTGNFRDLVFGDFPDESEIKASLQRIKERLSLLEWNIRI